jgi:broad specificity phosphatase PhoE
MGVLLLVRHGQASLGAADYDQLSGLGRRQAEIAGERLARTDLDLRRVVSGGMSRQRDTARAILVALGQERPGGLEVDERLDEYDHVAVLARHPGQVSFQTASGRALQSALEQAIGRWMSGGDGYAETHGAFLGRVRDAVRELAAAPGGTVAVTSGGVIAAVCAEALGLPAERWPNLARLIVNASITKIVTGRAGTSLVTFNDHAHLEGDRGLITYR